MDTLPTNIMEEEEEEEETEEEEGGESQAAPEIPDQESAVQKTRKPGWTPGFYYMMDKEVYHYVGQKIVIEEGLDSYAGMIWPGGLALCQYLDTHRQQLNLVGKAILELGSGTGLVSIVAALLGGWVTATDLPEYLSKLRVNLSRNTRGRCRHAPQVASLSWGFDLESSYPRSVYKYDYVLASDVVYHHDFLDELLATMKHFCQPGTTLLWANKVRFETDLTFMDNFKKAFRTSVLAEDGEMKIFMAKCREEGEGGVEVLEEELEDHQYWSDRGEERDENDEEAKEQDKSDEEEMGAYGDEGQLASCNMGHVEKTAVQQNLTPAWVPSSNISSSLNKLNKDVYHYAGQDIVIHESIDSFGAVMWPAALGLCSFLDTNRQTVDVQGKEVLELGAGTGLVTIVASLLGASATATDLPDVLSNLRSNVIRNTRGRCRHTPKVEALSWELDLKHSHPTSVYKYDYVLAADVVYHHDFLDELLATMKHFCQPGTTLIWANKVRFETDLTFTDNFKRAFYTSLLVEEGDMKIFMAKCRE